MTPELSKEEMIIQLEEYFGKRVFAIVYNPIREEGIKTNDETYIAYFIEKVIKKENIRDCVIILNGFGGDFRTSLLCSSLLRKNLNYYSCLIPSVVGSSLCYFVLQSNKLILGKNSKITQIDPLIEHEGEQLRAIKNLTHPDGEIRKKAHRVLSYNIEILKKILKKEGILNSSCFSNENEINIYELKRIIDVFMGKEFHESGLKFEELKKLKINLKMEDEEIIKISKEIVHLCRKELFEEEEGYDRLIIHTKNGSYFFQ